VTNNGGEAARAISTALTEQVQSKAYPLARNREGGGLVVDIGLPAIGMMTYAVNTRTREFSLD
jgi:hypothetical protein